MAFKLFILCVVLGLSAIASAQLSGSVSTNPNGGENVNLMASHRIGTPDHNAGAGVFASGNTNGAPVSTGAFADYNINKHGLSVQHTNTPGFGSTLQENARVNLFNNPTHNVDANAFHSRTNLDNGFKFDKLGGSLNYDHVRGHGASIGASHIPQIGGTTYDITGKANLWRSQDARTSLDAFGTASKTYGGPFDRQTNVGGGLGLTHRW